MMVELHPASPAARTAATACRALGCGLALLLAAHAAPGATGHAVPELAAFDREMEGFVQRWRMPGASLAVARHGRLVLARGFGVADRATGEPVLPESLFRIASVSKPVTATAVMQLVERGLLSLETPVFPYLARGTPVDPRLDRITLRHLLQHSGGWDSEAGFDPIVEPQRVAREMGVASPPDGDTVVRWLLAQPLQFEPGTREASSNAGYLVLGEVIAKATGQRYEDRVRTMLLTAGITRMRIGASLPAGRLPGEVVYHMPDGSLLVPSAFSSLPGPVPAPYGGLAVEMAAAAGGWVASAIDLVAFGAAVDGGPERAELLGAAALAEMLHQPVYASALDSRWYGLGWNVVTGGHRVHVGDAPGMGSLLVVAADGTVWAALLNMGSPSDSDAAIDDLLASLVRAYAAVAAWPAGDAFGALHDQGPITGCFGQPTLVGDTLCLPVVEVTGLGRYTATLKLVDSRTTTFELADARPALSASDPVAVFDVAQGLLTLPRVVLPMPGTAAAVCRATLQQVPGVPTLQLRLRDAAAP